MSNKFSREEYKTWLAGSLAPITEQVVFLHLPLEQVQESFADWVRTTQTPTTEVTMRRVAAQRANLPALLQPQQESHQRWLFCATDSEWVAVFVPNPRQTTEFFGLLDFLEYLAQAGELESAGEYNAVQLLARPRIIAEEDPVPVGYTLECPEPRFATIGDCQFRISNIGANNNITAMLGHQAYQPERYGVDSYRFINDFADEDVQDEIALDSAEVAWELPESYDYPATSEENAAHIWQLFGFEELDLLCDDLAISPFANDFYAEEGLLVSIKTKGSTDTEFEDFQYQIGAAPDIIRADRTM